MTHDDDPQAGGLGMTLDEAIAQHVRPAPMGVHAANGCPCAACHEARQAAKSDDTTRPLGPRLLAAWSASGMPLGRLLVYAAFDPASGSAVALPGVADEHLVEMVERYVDRARRDAVDRR